MRTLIISDLHLGSGSGADVLRSPEPRAALLEALRDVDRLVLLGDVLELRHGPPREAMAAARPFFEALGGVLGAPPAREIVLCAGNHDHQLVDPWLGERALRAPEPLGLEQRLVLEPTHPAFSPMLERIAAWAAPARVSMAYPGLWVRPDVYATHGHYLDCHLTVPTLERLSVAAMGRVLGRSASTFSEVEDYEAVGSPVFAWRDAVAGEARAGGAVNRIDTVRAWRALGGDGGGSSRTRKLRRLALAGDGGGLSRTRKLRRLALAGAFPLAVAALNRAGLGPLRADISTGELRRAGLRAMGEVADRLGLGDAHVIFGHTHRAGPLAGDLPAEWLGRGGARLVNAGCWTYDLAFLDRASGETPYWPGTCVLVEDDDLSTPPVLKRLLLDRSRAELASPGLAEPTPSPV